MVFVNVLLTAAFLTGAFAGFLWAFSKEKGDEFFSEMTADGSGKFHTFRFEFPPNCRMTRLSGVFLLYYC